MSLQYVPVDKDNWHILAKLKVREDQTHFVAPNLYSIAESKFGYDDEEGHWDFYPYGIYDGELPVGFFMYALNLTAPKLQAFVARLMVEKSQQGKGYGKFGIEKMLEIFRADERIRSVGISYEPENEVARKLYASFGFVETGEMLGQEVVAVVKLR
jgi:diamine N-acetyltransferase